MKTTAYGFTFGTEWCGSRDLSITVGGRRMVPRKGEAVRLMPGDSYYNGGCGESGHKITIRDWDGIVYAVRGRGDPLSILTNCDN